MKKLALTLCLAAFTTGAFAQGLVNFLNSPTTLISAGGTSTAATAGQYYFGLFTAPVGTTSFDAFQFSGIYATNLASAGRFTGGTGVPITGWAAGESRAFYVLGWSAIYGRDAMAALGYLNANLAPIEGGFAGRSAIAPAGVAGGGPQSLPNLNIFGGTQGLTAGFNMVLIPVPEPTSFALAGLGAAALLIFRRRK